MLNKEILIKIFKKLLEEAKNSYDDFNSRIKENIRRVKKLPKLKNVKEIMYPGQNKFNRHKKNFNKEIKITDDIKRDIEKLLN